MKRELLSSFGVLCGLAAATVFLCVRPEAAPALRQEDGPAVRKPAALTRATPQAAVELAVQAGDLGSRADRHASDALRVAEQASGLEDDLDWDYVQLRL
jgi:hypothetical protein